MDNTQDPQLPKAVADKYELKHLRDAGSYALPGIGPVDLSSIDLKMAAKIAKKTPYLVAKERTAEKKSEVSA
jgi:hypothetical protein